MEGRAFGQCTACSPAVVDAFRRDGWDLVLQAAKVRAEQCACCAEHAAAGQAEGGRTNCSALGPLPLPLPSAA